MLTCFDVAAGELSLFRPGLSLGVADREEKNRSGV